LSDDIFYLVDLSRAQHQHRRDETPRPAFAGATWCRAYLAAAFGLDVEHRAGARLLAVRDIFLCACYSAGRRQRVSATTSTSSRSSTQSNCVFVGGGGKSRVIATLQHFAACWGVGERLAPTGVLLGGSTLHSLLGSQRAKSAVNVVEDDGEQVHDSAWPPTLSEALLS
jgi:hypothetical protein